MDALSFCLTQAALAAFALGLVRRARLRGAEAWLTGLVLFAVTAEVLALGLGLAGLAARMPALIAAVALALVERLVPRGTRETVERTPEPPDLASRAAFGLLAGLLALWAVRLSLDGVRFTWDDLAYHATIVGYWLQTDSVAYAPYTYQVYYPLGAELFALWFSLPLDSLAMANLPILVWLATVSAAGLLLARRIGAGALPAALAVACAFVSPRILFFGNTLTANDLALAASAIAAIALAIHPHDDEADPGTRRALLSGLAAGMALGTKPSIAPQLLLLGVWWVVSVFRGKVRASAPVLFVLGTVPLGAFWYVRNWVTAGNPLFPAEIGPFAGPLSKYVQSHTAIGTFMVEDGFWAARGRSFLDWPVAAGILALLGFVGAPLVALRGIWSKRRNELLLLWACALLFLAIYPMQPFSGRTNKPLSQYVFSWRYLTFPVLAGWILVSSWAASSRPVVRAVVTTVLAGVFCACALLPGDVELAAALESGVVHVGAALGGAAVCVLLGPRLASALARRPLALAAGVTVLLALGLPHRAEAARENVYGFTDYWPGWRDRPQPPVGAAWRALEELPDGARVGVLSYQPSSHVHSFPLMGSRLQHRAVTLLPDGRERGLLHETWRDEPDHWWWEFDQLEAVITPEEFRANLEASDLDYLVVSRWPRNERTPWPESRTTATLAYPAEAIVFRDRYSMIWKLR